ncbi:hypothetical protein UMZ34_11240 [Halopseudomonas pachastrellae]|nr:hypothetical protein UMZ34_11240 [Halopseudomonas pachastrellae]
MQAQVMQLFGTGAGFSLADQLAAFFGQVFGQRLAQAGAAVTAPLVAAAQGAADGMTGDRAEPARQFGLAIELQVGQRILQRDQYLAVASSSTSGSCSTALRSLLTSSRASRLAGACSSTSAGASLLVLRLMVPCAGISHSCQSG